MNNQRIIIGLLWLVSIVATYFIGNATTPIQQPAAANSASAQASSEQGDSARARRAVVQKLDASDEEPGRGKANIAMLIAKARAELGSGMGGMMNMRGMFRAIAPLVDLDDSQIQEALAEVEKSIKEPQQKMMFYSILLGQWAEKDGKAALAYANDKLKGNAMFDMGIKGSIVGAWARTNPDAAWRWFEAEGKAESGDRKNMMMVSSLFAGIASQDLDSAIARLDSLDESQRQMAISGISMSGMNAEGRRRLLDRSGTLPEKTRDAIRQNALSQWAMMDSDEALKWLRSLPAEEQKPLRQSVAQSVMMMDPKKGGEALLQDATEEEKPRLYDQIVGQWAYQDAKASGEWLTKQPQGPELDSARMTYATIVAQKDPAAAMDWAKSVTKPESREQAIGQVYQRWKQRDATAAEAALGTSGLSPESIGNIRKSQTATGEATLESATRVGPK